MQRGHGNQQVQRLLDRARTGRPGDRFEREADRIARQVAARPEPIAGTLERMLGADLSDVRVHHDARSADLNEHIGTRAFTTGRDVYLGGGYEAASRSGRHTLAHELTHVVQQTDGTTATVGAGAVPAVQHRPKFLKKLAQKLANNHDAEQMMPDDVVAGDAGGPIAPTPVAAAAQATTFENLKKAATKLAQKLANNHDAEQMMPDDVVAGDAGGPIAPTPVAAAAQATTFENLKKAVTKLAQKLAKDDDLEQMMADDVV
jgi:hypothetical protein